MRTLLKILGLVVFGLVCFVAGAATVVSLSENMHGSLYDNAP
jgi:hypothetical protein